jgi:hypothetical protein
MSLLTINSKRTAKLLPLLVISAALMMSESSFADNAPQRINPTQAHTQSHQPNLAPTFQIPFAANCAQGFNKAGQKIDSTDSGKWTDEFVCTTQVITCPKQKQGNGQTSTVQPLVVIQKTLIDPDGSQVKFRVQYKCDYHYTVLPEG